MAAARLNSSARPNPFARSVILDFTTDRTAEIFVTLINLRGETVLRQAIGRRAAGAQQIELETSELERGAYFYRIEAGTMVYSGGVVRGD